MSESADALRKRQQRERTAKHRAKHRQKVKEQSANGAAAMEQRRQYTQADFDLWRENECLVMPGERAPGIDAETVPEALIVCREFLLALGQPDIQLNECLLSAERRVVTAWNAAGLPLLNRNTLRLDTSVASTDDGYTFDLDKSWVALPGSDQQIDIATLPVIEQPEIVEVPAAYTPPIVEVAPTIEAAIMKAQQREELASR